MSICTVCGYDKNPDGSEFCDACGAELTVSSGNSNPPIYQAPVNQSFSIEPTVVTTPPPMQSQPTIQSFAPEPIPIAPEPMPIAPPPPIEPVNQSFTPPAPIPQTISSPPPVFNSEAFSESHRPIPIPVAEATTAKLIAKQPNAPIPEFPLESSNIIGIFNEEPVEIDLEGFYGNETVSSQHAEIYQDNGFWMIKDLGSTNGIFIKPVGQSRFGARVTVPTILNSGDEIAIAKIRFQFQSF